MNIGQLFEVILVAPILNFLVAFYKVFLLIHLPGAFGFAIIALVVLIRALVQPFFRKQLETAKKMQELRPHLDRLNKKHKDDPKQLQAAQLKLYQEMGINPAAGCLYMIIQLPIFIGLYNTLSRFLSHGTGATLVASINKSLYFPFLKIQSIDPNFFGFNLALSPQKSGLWFYYLIPVITGILQYYQATASIAPAPVLPPTDEKDSKDEKKSNNGQDFQNAMNTQMKYFFPVLIAYFSYTLPVGLSLYYNIFSLFSIMQYRQLHTEAEKVEKEIILETKEIKSEKKKSPKQK
jgi:YidC/Oxa1 family membrane protein insertase